MALGFIGAYDDLLLKGAELRGKRLRIEILPEEAEDGTATEECGISPYLLDLIETAPEFLDSSTPDPS